MNKFFKILSGILIGILIFNIIYYSIILVPIKSWEATIGAHRTKISADGRYVAYLVGGRVGLLKKDNTFPIRDYISSENFEALDISADGSYIVAGSNKRNQLCDSD